MATAHPVVSLVSLVSVDEVDPSDDASHSGDSRACVSVFAFNYRVDRPIVAVDVRSWGGV